MTMKGFKVVRKEWGKTFVSAFCVAKLKYGIGMTTVPNPTDGPLCLFVSCEAAEEFVRKELCVGHIFECEYEPATEMRAPQDAAGDPAIWHYWRDSLGNITSAKPVVMKLWELPAGTILAKSITLTKELQ